MKNLLASIGQLLFTNLCICCQGYLSQQEKFICDFCEFELPRFESFEQKDNAVAKKFWGSIKTDVATAYLTYGKGGAVQRLMHELKYRGNRELGIEMGKWLGWALNKNDLLANVDVLIPIPLHNKRQRERGYNQAELLCRGLHEVTQIPVASDAVTRERYNVTQTKKKRYERYINAKELFRVNTPELLENKHVLLIDDVITTGSTMISCGEVLLDVKGLRLSLASLAVATY